MPSVTFKTSPEIFTRMLSKISADTKENTKLSIFKNNKICSVISPALAKLYTLEPRESQ